MNLFAYSLLADENIHPDVVRYLRQQGYDVLYVMEEELAGNPDSAILRFAYQSNRVVLTHDSDFGTLAIAQGEPVVGIIYLRPGHIQSSFTIETIDVLVEKSIDVSTTFMVIAVRSGNQIRVRVRQL